MPTAIQDNPYIIGVPIDDPRLLFGRERLFDFVRDNLLQGAKVILLSGQRRMGKSSLLRQLPKVVDLPEFVFVPFDLQGATQLTLGELLYRIGEEILRVLEANAEDFPVLQEVISNPKTFAGSFLPAAYAILDGRNLVLLLDEFDALGDESDKEVSERFFSYLQSVVQADAHLFVIAVIGRRLHQMPAVLSLFKGAPHQEIGRLSRENTEKQIVRPAEQVLSYRPDALDAIFALSAGHPYFTQLLCHTLFQRAREEDEWTVTVRDVEAVVGDAIIAGEGGLTWFRDGLEVPERVVFSAIAELPEPKTRKRLEHFLQERSSTKRTGNAAADLLESYGVVVDHSLILAQGRLREWGFVEDAPEHFPGERFLRVTVELVRRWLVQRHATRWEIFELEALVPAAQSLYEQGLEAYKKTDRARAITVWEQALEANPNHLHALGELAEAYASVYHWVDAVKAYERAYLSDPARHKEGYVEALLNYANELMRQNNYRAARNELNRAVGLSGGDSSIERRLKEAERGVRRTIAAQNPFFVGSGVPRESFVGRTSLVAELLSSVGHGGHTAIYGEMGMGKTSLLKHISSADVLAEFGLSSSGSATIYFDCQAIAPFTPSRFASALLEEVSKQLAVRSSTGVLRSLQRKLSGTSELEELQRMLSQSGPPVVLLLDEFGTTLQAGESCTQSDILKFQSALRGLALSSPRISVVVTTKRRLSELMPEITSAGSPLYNHFRSLPLRPFTNEEVNEAAARMPAELEPLTEEEQRWLGFLGGGYPYVVEAVLSLLFRLRTSNRRFELKTATTELALEVDPFFSALWQGFDKYERIALCRMAVARYAEYLQPQPQFELTPNQLYTKHARSLTERGIVQMPSSPPSQGATDESPKIASGLLEFWVIRKVSTLSPDELQVIGTKLTQSLIDSLAGTSTDQQIQALLQKIDAWGTPPE